MSRPEVTNHDINEALRQLREEAGGHEPYAPGVWPRAQKIAADVRAAEIRGATWALEAMNMHFPTHTPKESRATRIVDARRKEQAK